MGRLYNNLKRIYEKIQIEKDATVYQDLLTKFVTLITYEDLYLMPKTCLWINLRPSGVSDMLIDCGGYGIIVDKEDKISVHT